MRSTRARTGVSSSAQKERFRLHSSGSIRLSCMPQNWTKLMTKGGFLRLHKCGSYFRMLPASIWKSSAI
jgi:hypothetical protein